MYDILQENTNGWDYLSQPISDVCYPEIANVLCEMKKSEEKNVALVRQILDGHIVK